MLQSIPFSYLCFSLGVSDDQPPALSDKEWVALHRWAEKQSLIGIFFDGVQKLPAGRKPPQKLCWRWAMEAEHIRGLNKKLNKTTVELTQLFEQFGHKAVVLKGSANALLYSDPSLRQTGDIDFFIPGGRNVLVELLENTGLKKNARLNSYHASFQYAGEEVEIHYIATRQYAPTRNKALQSFLSKEVPESLLSIAGFYVPNPCYALMMQLGHIKQHFFKGGVGLRQLVDYFQLLQNASDDARIKVSAKLKDCGLDKMAGAVMWTLREVLHLNDEKMLCKPDARRGKLLLKVALNGGNFGWYAEDYRQSVFARWFKDRVRFLKLLSFDATESLWHEIRYWIDTISLTPRRIKRGRLALGKR